MEKTVLEILELQAEVRQNAKHDKVQNDLNTIELEILGRGSLMGSSPTSGSPPSSTQSGVKRKSHAQEDDPFAKALMAVLSDSDGQDQHALQRMKLELDEKRLNAEIMRENGKVRFPISMLSVSSMQPIFGQLQLQLRESNERMALERIRAENELKMKQDTLASEERRDANQREL